MKLQFFNMELGSLCNFHAEVRGVDLAMLGDRYAIVASLHMKMLHLAFALQPLKD